MMLAEAVLPTLPLVELTLPVVSVKFPASTPVTVTLKEVLPPTPIVPLEKLMVPGAVVTSVPLPAPNEPLATASPAGSVSMKATPVSATPLAAGLVSVNVKVVLPLSGIETAPKLAAMIGGATTVRLCWSRCPDRRCPSPPRSWCW